jgi:hypothetical protein
MAKAKTTEPKQRRGSKPPAEPKAKGGRPRASRREPEELDLPHPEFEKPSDATLERLDRERADAVADSAAASKAKAEAEAAITKRLRVLGYPAYKAKSGRVLFDKTKDVVVVKRPPAKAEQAKAQLEE